MYVKSTVTECDFTGRQYDNPVMGAEVLAQGATGRWCCVMTVGPEEIKRAGIVPISRAAAVEQCLDSLRGQNLNRPEPGQYSEEELMMFIDF